jgi:hypothetical protein
LVLPGNHPRLKVYLQISINNPLGCIPCKALLPYWQHTEERKDLKLIEIIFSFRYKNIDALQNKVHHN